MEKKPLLILTGCLVFSMTLIAVLYAFSDKGGPQRDNSFFRVFPPDPLKELNTIDIGYNSYYIAGGSGHQLYLGNATAPAHLIVTNTLLTDTQQVWLSIENLENLRFRSVRVSVDSPYFYLMDGIMPGLLRGTVGDWHADRFMYDSAYFTDAVPISPSSFALRTVSSSTNEYVLVKETAFPPHVTLVPGLLEKQIDGQFCVDGMLRYNRELKRLVYLYYYRNQYVVMDTSLNLVYRGHTIDTNSWAKIKVADIASDNSRTLAAPPQMVNLASSTSGDWLLVSSGLMAGNENEELFEQASVIDAYHLKDRAYKFSFYLTNRDRRKAHGFRIFGDKLIALYDHYVVSYQLNPEYFQVTSDEKS